MIHSQSSCTVLLRAITIKKSSGEFLWAGRDWMESISFDSSKPPTVVLHLCISLAPLCPAVFGAVHVASWNVRLSSDVELWMRRASSLYCLIIETAVAVSMLLNAYNKLLGRLYDISKNLFLFFGPVYIIIRAYMIAEVFLSLRALPSSAFQSVQWSSFVPNV